MPRRRRSWPSTISRLLVDVVTLVGFAVTSRSQLAAENLFLRKQLALYQERRVKPRRPEPATRIVLVLLSRLLDWRALTVVQPIVRAGGSCGGGSRDQDGRPFRGSCNDSSCAWPRRTAVTRHWRATHR